MISSVSSVVDEQLRPQPRQDVVVQQVWKGLLTRRMVLAQLGALMAGPDWQP